jgi:CubicO group peptidase (beta-lactamase class C family)
MPAKEREEETLVDRTLRCGVPAEAGMSPERVARLPGLCAGWVEQGLTPALQVAVARRGVVVLHEAWGRLGPEPDAPPLGVDSIFPIASLTKPITATAVMCLVEDGALGLNRPVQEYVPEFAGEGKEAVMVHHLLTHTSGLRTVDLEAHALAKITAGIIRPPEPLSYLKPDEWLSFRCFDAIHDAPLWKPPGAEMSYCNYGYDVLAEIVTRVTGQPAACLVQERILDPLEMASTSYAGLPPARLDRLVRRSSDAPFAVLNRPDLTAALALGGASVYSTALDLTVFAQMFLNGGAHGGARVLSRASVAEMTRNQIPGVNAQWLTESFPEASWGYGWGIQGDKKPLREGSLLSAAAFSHSGAGMMFLWADPVYELACVYLSVAPLWIPFQRHDACPDLLVNVAVASIID